MKQLFTIQLSDGTHRQLLSRTTAGELATVLFTISGTASSHLDSCDKSQPMAVVPIEKHEFIQWLAECHDNHGIEALFVNPGPPDINATYSAFPIVAFRAILQ